MGLGQYNSLSQYDGLEEYCGPHTASSVFLILVFEDVYRHKPLLKLEILYMLGIEEPLKTLTTPFEIQSRQSSKSERLKYLTMQPDTPELTPNHINARRLKEGPPSTRVDNGPSHLHKK